MSSNKTHSNPVPLLIETSKLNNFSNTNSNLNHKNNHLNRQHNVQSPNSFTIKSPLIDEPISALSPHHSSYTPYEFKCITADGSELLISIDSWCSSGSSLSPPCLHYVRLNKTQSIYRDAFQILDLLSAHHIEPPQHFQKQRPISAIDKFVENVFDKLRKSKQSQLSTTALNTNKARSGS